MKKVIFISALAIAAAVSCTKSDIVDTKFNEQIGFEAYAGRDAQTKATVVDEASDLTDGFGLYGFYTGADVWKSNSLSNLWGNLKVNSNGSYADADVKYWTNKTDLYTFLAYAPYAVDGNVSYGDGSLSLSGVGTETANPTITYKVPTLLSNQKDVLYSNNNVNITQPDNKAPVNIKFFHALSRITVKAYDNNPNYTYKIYGIKVNGKFIQQDDLDIRNGNWATNGVVADNAASKEYVFKTYETETTGTGEDAVVTPKNGVLVTGETAATATDFAGDNNYLMVIPTNLSTVGFDLTIVYTSLFGGTVESKPMEKTLNVKQEFVKGKAYSLLLGFEQDKTSPITFKVEIDNWDPATGTDVTAGNPEVVPAN